MKDHAIAHYILTIFWVLVKLIVRANFWIILTVIGWYNFRFAKSPYDLVVGLPMLLLGLGLTINEFMSMLLIVLSPIYNKGVCPFCNSSSLERE